MKKPIAKQREPVFDYHECEKYIAEKLGIENLRDCAGKFKYKFGTEEFDAKPHQDFWHEIVDSCAGNGTEMYIGGAYDEDRKSFEKEGKLWVWTILKAFTDEFGEDAVYWVEW